jgi:hypothetical protein
MRRTIIKILILVFACSLLTLFKVADAQVIDSYNPTEHDFGNRAIGSYVTQVFTVKNSDSGGLTVFAIDLTSNNTQPFYAYTGDSLEIISGQVSYVDSNTSFEIEVSFSPTTVGDHNAYLRIVTDATNFGVDSEVPSEQIALILDFFETSASGPDPSLVGSGPNTESAENRLNAFWNMLLSAQDLIESGDYVAACEQLLDAYLKCDADPLPPDFVQGDAASSLAQMIANLRDSIGCP